VQKVAKTAARARAAKSMHRGQRLHYFVAKCVVDAIHEIAQAARHANMKKKGLGEGPQHRGPELPDTYLE